MAWQNTRRDFRYWLEIDGIEQASFREVTIPDTEQDPIEYLLNADRYAVRKAQSSYKNPDIILRRGIIRSKALIDWLRRVTDGSTPLDDVRRTVVMRVQNEAGEDRAAFKFIRAWPCKFDPTDLNAEGNEVAVDSLQLCNEGSRVIEMNESDAHQ